MFDMDFENFDGRTSAEVLEAVLELVQRYYNDGEEAKTVRRILLEEMIHTVSLCGDTLYIKHGGMPSGSPLTVVFNTLVNCFYMYYAYMHLVPAPLADDAVFRRSVAFKIYGDDNVGAVVKSLQPYYNPTRIAALMKEHGIVITPASKEGVWKDDMTIDDVTFLKRGFKVQPDINAKMYVPQMADRTIQELTNWIHDNGDSFDMTMCNCETALRFAMFKGRSYFENFRTKVLDALQRVHSGPIYLPHFSQLNRKFNLEHCGVDLPPSNEEIHLAHEQLGERIAIPQMEQLGAPMNMMEPGVLHMHGVDIVTQTGVVTDGRKDEKHLTQHVQKDSIAELPWSIKSIAERENFFDNVPWDATASYPSPLMNFTIPDAAFPDSPILRIMRQFTYYRGDWVFTFQLNGTRFHQGALIASFTPLTRATTTSMLLSKVHSTSMRHVTLLASSSTTAQLRIPFIHTQTYLPTLTSSDEEMKLGRIMVQVLNSL